MTGNDQLRVAAERHAVDMRDNPAVRSDPNHLGSDGSTPPQRIADAGYAPASRTGEIMYWASGPPGNTPRATIDWWMNSPPHKAIIETCELTGHRPVGRELAAWRSLEDRGDRDVRSTSADEALAQLTHQHQSELVDTIVQRAGLAAFELSGHPEGHVDASP